MLQFFVPALAALAFAAATPPTPGTAAGATFHGDYRLVAQDTSFLMVLDEAQTTRSGDVVRILVLGASPGYQSIRGQNVRVLSIIIEVDCRRRLMRYTDSAVFNDALELVDSTPPPKPDWGEMAPGAPFEGAFSHLCAGADLPIAKGSPDFLTIARDYWKAPGGSGRP